MSSPELYRPQTESPNPRSGANAKKHPAAEFWPLRGALSYIQFFVLTSSRAPWPQASPRAEPEPRVLPEPDAPPEPEPRVPPEPDAPSEQLSPG